MDVDLAAIGHSPAVTSRLSAARLRPAASAAGRLRVKPASPLLAALDDIPDLSVLNLGSDDGLPLGVSQVGSLAPGKAQRGGVEEPRKSPEGWVMKEFVRS